MGADNGPVTAYNQLAGKIRQQILSGELSPGDQLPTEAELSAAYRLSRNTAREALRALAGQGLLTIRRGVAGGTFVSVPSPEQVTDSLQTSLALLAESSDLPVSSLVEMREMLEVPAAEIAALRRSSEQLAAVRSSLFDPRAVDPGAVFGSTADFHRTILKAANNPLLQLLAEPVFYVLQQRILRDRAPREFWHQVDSDHREVLSCLEQMDQAGAREAMRAHLRFLRGAYERIDRDRVNDRLRT